jgi:hypothetical protein
LLGAFLGALALSLALPRGLLPLLLLAGFFALLGGGALLLRVLPQAGTPALPLAAALLGLGAGATVSPGLYMAGFSLPSPLLARCFALVELLRCIADYSIAPVMRHVAQIASAGEAIAAAGIRQAIITTLAVSAAAGALAAAVYLAGKGWALPRTDIACWLQGRGPAHLSPPLGAALRAARAKHLSSPHPARRGGFR